MRLAYDPPRLTPANCPDDGTALKAVSIPPAGGDAQPGAAPLFCGAYCPTCWAMFYETPEAS